MWSISMLETQHSLNFAVAPSTWMGLPETLLWNCYCHKVGPHSISIEMHKCFSTFLCLFSFALSIHSLNRKRDYLFFWQSHDYFTYWTFLKKATLLMELLNLYKLKHFCQIIFPTVASIFTFTCSKSTAFTININFICIMLLSFFIIIKVVMQAHL